MSLDARSADPSFRILIGRFVSGLPERLSELEATAAEGRLLDVQRLAHQLKGAGGSFGFGQLTEPAHAVETLAGRGAPIEEVLAAIQRLGIVCDAIEVNWVA